MRRGSWSMAWVAASLLTGTALAQVSDALKDRVHQLVARLDSEKPEARDAAERALIDLGPRILPLLDDTEASAPAARKEGIARVRAALRKAEENVNLGASKITIRQKGIRLTEAVKRLQSQSGNTINDLRDAEGVDVTNPSLDLDIADKPFFEALDVICAEAGLTPSFFTGDGSIGLMAGAMPGAPPKTKPMVVYGGPFRVQFKQIATVRDFDAGSTTTNAQFELAWEPRLRPMVLAFKPDGIDAKTDEGKPVTRDVMGESDDVALRPENPAAEVNLNLVAPDRSARELATLHVKGEVTLPAGIKTFRFKSLEAKDQTIKDGDIAVTLESTTIEEGIWRVNVTVDYPDGEGPAFESYRQGLFNNRLWLQKADGSRFEHNGGFNNTGSDEGKLSFEYLFVDAPGKLADYGLVYETPSKVVTIPLEFEFKKVPLP